MTNQPSSDPAAAAPPLLPRHFQRGAFFIGAGYMLLMFGASEFLGSELPLRLWWWTALPVCWFGALAIHLRYWGGLGPLGARLVEEIRRRPGYSVFWGGMAVVIEGTMVLAPWSEADAASPHLTGFYVAAGIVVAAAVATSVLARRKR